MPRRQDTHNSHQQRQLIASTAARLIAEDGINDFQKAKRKAAAHLGLPENVGLPENSEVEAELRVFHRLFHAEEHHARINVLRRQAAAVMRELEAFNPYLTGSVLDGTAGRFAEVDIQLFTDSAKDVEIFLLNRHIDFYHSQPRTDRAEAVLTIRQPEADVNLIVYPRHEERVTFKTRDGRIRQRARLSAVEKLLEGDSVPTKAED